MPHKLPGGKRPDQFQWSLCLNLASTDLISKPHSNHSCPAQRWGYVQFFQEVSAHSVCLLAHEWIPNAEWSPYTPHHGSIFRSWGIPVTHAWTCLEGVGNMSGMSEGIGNVSGMFGNHPSISSSPSQTILPTDQYKWHSEMRSISNFSNLFTRSLIKLAFSPVSLLLLLSFLFQEFQEKLN